MSATNRGARRRTNDLYETPEWLTEAIVPQLARYNPRRILEPAAGGGAIVRVLRRAFSTAVIDQGDISTGQDFLTHPYAGPYDLIITNPPYSLALEFVKRALPLHASRGAVVMLLRMNWLGSQERAPWMRLHTPSMYVTPRRPSFINGGSDATEYAWMIWDCSPARVVILNTDGDSRSGKLFAESITDTKVV